MKKLLILVAVLVFSTATMAGTVSVQVVPPGPYTPSQIVTVNVVNDDFPTTPQMQTIAKMDIAALTASAGTAEAVGTLCDELKAGLYNEGALVNSGGDLITGLYGSVALGTQTGPPPGTVLYSYEFHIPEVPYSTIITLGIDGLVLKHVFGQELVANVIPAEIHVTPEPMTIALLGLGGLFLRRRK